MQQFVNSIRASIESNNWHAALTLAMTLPDICGCLENPSMGSKARYVAWYDQFMLKRYQSSLGPSKQLHTFLYGSDCYALRCAYLHQGEFGIEDQSARKTLDKFHFIVPPGKNSIIHMNQCGNTLQLQIDIFCLDVCASVEEWMSMQSGKSDIQEKLLNIGRIYCSPNF
ncbi:hypothetical protein [Undibacterium luofuense]|uniref:Uncharacterized protein n=1 Tax=Undibacterium luofuense TaxID=2828733 RepID=A0A941I4L5_9BURK|nr:hypothetical protein [Undibacterium luofuense]MBR7780641.1 hypothetical protein [Undibacterium luofuense]